MIVSADGTAVVKEIFNHAWDLVTFSHVSFPGTRLMMKNSVILRTFQFRCLGTRIIGFSRTVMWLSG